MVTFEEITKKLDELSHFFQSIKEGTDANVTDKGSASYGFEKVRLIHGLIEAYKKKPSNVLLKRMHSAFSSVTRGLEGFVDYNTDQLFRKKCEGITEIFNDLEENIRW